MFEFQKRYLYFWQAGVTSAVQRQSSDARRMQQRKKTFGQKVQYAANIYICLT